MNLGRGRRSAPLLDVEGHGELVRACVVDLVRDVDVTHHELQTVLDHVNPKPSTREAGLKDKAGEGSEIRRLMARIRTRSALDSIMKPSDQGGVLYMSAVDLMVSDGT